MPRLIDADVLLQNLEWFHEYDYIEYEAIKRSIDKVPTVDAEPVRHGKWTHTKGSNMRHDYTCSLCGCRISGVDPFSLSATAYYYCPECGAKMDEVEDGS